MSERWFSEDHFDAVSWPDFRSDVRSRWYRYQHALFTRACWGSIINAWLTIISLRRPRTPTFVDVRERMTSRVTSKRACLFNKSLPSVLPRADDFHRCFHRGEKRLFGAIKPRWNYLSAEFAGGMITTLARASGGGGGLLDKFPPRLSICEAGRYVDDVDTVH